jgi:hypothetical protein
MQILILDILSFDLIPIKKTIDNIWGSTPFYWAMSAICVTALFTYFLKIANLYPELSHNSG